MITAKTGALLVVAGPPVIILALIIGMITLVAVGDRSDASTGPGGLILPGSVPAAYERLVDRAGTRCPEIGAPLIAAQLQHESGFDPRATSPVGARGIAQFMPATWRIWGRDHSGDGVADVWNAEDAIGSQADYLCGLTDMITSWIRRGRVHGDLISLALAGYNAGPASVLQAHGIPPIPETRSYLKIILATRDRFSDDDRHSNDSRDAVAIAAAQAEDHDRYVFGAAGPDAWDCSSLVQHAWHVAGVDLPRTTFEQVSSPLLHRVSWQDRRRGDLIYFHIEGGALPDHVGLILSDRLMIHASHPHPDPEDDIVQADYTTSYYRNADPVVMRVTGP